MPSILPKPRNSWGRWRYYLSGPPPAEPAKPVPSPVFTLDELARVLRDGAFAGWLVSAGYADTNPYVTGAEAFVDFLDMSAQAGEADE